MTSAMPVAPGVGTLTLDAPIDRWDEAIPLGNGRTGVLFYGDGSALRLALDRGDLWDLRPSPRLNDPQFNVRRMVELVRAGEHDRVRELFDDIYLDPTPTKIPAGRLMMHLPAGTRARQFALNLATATAWASLDQGEVEAFCSAAEPVTLIRMTGNAALSRLELQPPDFTRGDREARRSHHAPTWVLDYPPTEFGEAAEQRWFVQSGTLGLRYAVVVQTRRVGGEQLAAAALCSTADGDDPLALARQRVAAALEAGYAAMHEAHRQWWAAFWSRSAVQVPDPAVQLHYDLVQYFYGSASRRGAPPMPLQGVWTADEGRLPPWKGDYHHDLNTQLCYWAYLAAGHLDEGLCFLDFLWDLLPTARRFAREFFGTGGAMLPSVMSLTGQPLGGWVQYSYAPTNMAWVCQAFDWHWRYTQDRSFLAERAYPFCREVAQCLADWLETDANQRLKLPLSSSPEVHDNRPQAWLTANSNYDLALLQWLFATVAEMAETLGESEDAGHWLALHGRLEPLAVERGPDGADDGALRLDRDESLAESHRHFSHLMAIHPLGLIHVEADERQRRIIQRSLHQLDQLGTGRWCGYSFSWLACLAARVKEPERALNMLELYLKGFVSRNGFHLNGDYRNQGLSAMNYRPFTLEGNFAAGRAVQDMLLQSWGGRVRVFPAVSSRWADAAFVNLRAEGAWLVSAQRRGGRTSWLRIEAEAGGQLRLQDPFAGRPAKWNRHDIRCEDGDYVVHLDRGQVLEGWPGDEAAEIKLSPS